MPKIVITEVDNTSPGIIDESTDVVYIPGFVNLDKDSNGNYFNDNLYKKDSQGNIVYDEQGKPEYIGIKPNEPTLFTSISEFESLCGVQPAYFSEDQTYDSLVGDTPNADGSMPGFSSDAIPYHGIMFSGPVAEGKVGQADPAYVMAKELLSAGLNVLYERVNADDYTETFSQQQEQPSDWEEYYYKYEIASECLVDVTDTTVPTMFTKQNGEVYNPELTYYTRGTIIDPQEYEPGRIINTIAFVPVGQDRQEGPEYVTVSYDPVTSIISQPVGDSVPEYFVLTSQLPEVEQVKYFTKNTIEFSQYIPKYEANKYYALQNGVYLQLSSSTPPTDWGQGTYYENKGSAEQPDYEQVQFVLSVSPQYTANTYYKPTLLTDAQPGDWGTATYYEKVSGVYKEVAEETPYKANKFYKLEQVTQSAVPDDWKPAEGQYCEPVESTEPVEYKDVTITLDYLPKFEEFNETTVLVYDSENNCYNTVTTKPDNWGIADFYTSTQVSLQTLEVTSAPQPDPENRITYYEGTMYLPHSWITGYKQGVQSSIIYNPVQSVITSTGTESAPVWDNKATYRLLDNGINIANMYKCLQSVYAITDTGLSDKGNYSIKYLTSGGYPVYEYNQNSIVTQMMALCQERGDCVAFIDHTDNPHRNQNIDQPGSLYYTVKNDLTFQTGGEFATMFTPWATYTRTTTDLDDQLRTAEGYKPTIRMPGSYAYFLGLGDSIQTNPNWLAIAGVARGLVRNLASGGMTTNIPNGAADKMTPRDALSVNPITNIKPYGYTIWGNRTLKNNATEGNLTATSFLATRNLVSDIKKEVYRVCRKLTFEQNTDVLWVNFKSEMTPLLDRMLHGYGISNYKLQKDVNHPRFNERATLCVKIIISPVDAVEDFYVSIILEDNDNVTVTE